MNKLFFKGIIVVEGKSDINFLSTFLNGKFFSTNGCDINDKKLNLLNKLSNTNQIIVITDPDKKGNEIRNKISNKIDNVVNVVLDKEFCKNKKKIGLAESNIEYVIDKIKEKITLSNDEMFSFDINLSNILQLNKKYNINVKNLISKIYDIEIPTNKTFLKILYLLDFNLDILEKFIEDILNGKRKYL